MQALSRFFRRQLRGLGRLGQHGIEPVVVKRLEQFLIQAKDRELYHANPRHWAERLNLDERAVLALIVAGVAEGLLELYWKTLCPVCKYYDRSASTLGGLIGLHHCVTCDHDYQASLDDEIVVTVSTSDQVRRLAPARRDDPTFRAVVDARYQPVPAIAMLLTPTFWERMGNQTLPEGESLGVNRLVICLFDLAGAAWPRHELAAAETLRLSSEQFKVLSGAAARHNGLATRIGGAGMMAVFRELSDALRGGAEALGGWRQTAAGSQTALKAALHVGPCVLISREGRLEFGGGTVSLAAHLATLAQGKDIVLSPTVLADPEARAVAERLGPVTTLGSDLPGIGELHHLIVSPSGS